MSRAKVCHLSSVHAYDDIRIFHKECRVLASHGYETHFVSSFGSQKLAEAVHLHNVPQYGSGRLTRMSRTVWSIYRKALALDADLYHFHDPELIPVGLLLKLKAKKVVYDVHEDAPRQTMSKEYLPKPVRRSVAWSIEKIEDMFSKYFDAVIVATPFIQKRFERIGCRTVNVNNYPRLDELYLPDMEWLRKEKAVCYVGSISEKRGLYEMLRAVSGTDARLFLAGTFSSDMERCRARDMPGWSQTEEMGQVGRKDVAHILSRSHAGLVVLHPLPNYIEAQPIKMFEYMSAGIPVIASNFPRWKAVVEGYGCGICVDPLNPDEITEAIQWILHHPDKAEKMGANGRKAVESKYNSVPEERKLLSIYEALLS